MRKYQIDALDELARQFDNDGKRQFLLVTESRQHLIESKNKFNENMPLELVSQDIRFFLNNIAEITGEISNNDLYDILFSKFCIGK